VTVTPKVEPVPKPVEAEAGGASATAALRLKLKLQTYSGEGTETWKAYATHVEIMKMIHAWSEPETLMMVMASMKGKALIHLTNMLPADRTQLDTLLSSFEERFGVVEHRSTLLAEFQNRRQKANESFRDVGNDLRVLARKAYPTFSGTQIEDLMKVQFLAAVRNPNVRFALGQRTCVSLAAMIADAEQLARLGSDAFGERQFQTGTSSDGGGGPDDASSVGMGTTPTGRSWCR
jgi:hypothetical protein